MEFDSKDRKKSIKVWVSDEERCLLETKARYYGYKRLSKYVRDAIIYEKVTRVDVDNQDKIYDAYAINTKELKKITKEIRYMLKYLTQIDEENIKKIKSLMNNIIKNQNKMLDLIDEKLDLDVWQEINHNKEMSEE